MTANMKRKKELQTGELTEIGLEISTSFSSNWSAKFFFVVVVILIILVNYYFHLPVLLWGQISQHVALHLHFFWNFWDKLISVSSGKNCTKKCIQNKYHLKLQ